MKKRHLQVCSDEITTEGASSKIHNLVLLATLHDITMSFKLKFDIAEKAGGGV